MIKPDEIRQQALKWWKPLLQSYVSQTQFFPKQIDRIGRIQPTHITHRFEALRTEIEELYKHSKNETSTGYVVKTAGRSFRRTGTHELPDAIEFETLDDYLQFTGKKREWKLFQKNYEIISSSLSNITDWIIINVLSLTVPEIDWDGIMKVCQYFIDTPRPNLYLRQLPIQVHTKFIEEHSPLLQSLLDFLIPDHIRNKEQRRFAERYFLNHDEPLIRIKILDEKIAVFNNVLDISIRLSDFERSNWVCSNIIIAENKMNFLTLPSLDSSIAIWSGGGFNVSHLKYAMWLKTKNIFYWGDIDEHGFQILSQIRGYYPQTISVMMDKETFDGFQEFTVNGERNKIDQLLNLNDNETALYSFIKRQDKNNRLEQEKIPQAYVDRMFKQMWSLQKY